MNISDIFLGRFKAIFTHITQLVASPFCFPGVGVIASCKTQCEDPCCITTTTTSTTFTSITTTVSWRLDWIMFFFS